MEAKISDIHDSHGLVFTLDLKKDGLNDEVVDFLQRRLKHIVSGSYRNSSTLYLHEIKISPEGVTIRFVESMKGKAKLDFSTNNYSKDGKFTVLAIEVGADEVPGGRSEQDLDFLVEAIH